MFKLIKIAIVALISSQLAFGTCGFVYSYGSNSNDLEAFHHFRRSLDSQDAMSVRQATINGRKVTVVFTDARNASLQQEYVRDPVRERPTLMRNLAFCAAACVLTGRVAASFYLPETMHLSFLANLMVYASGAYVIKEGFKRLGEHWYTKSQSGTNGDADAQVEFVRNEIRRMVAQANEGNGDSKSRSDIMVVQLSESRLDGTNINDIMRDLGPFEHGTPQDLNVGEFADNAQIFVSAAGNGPQSKVRYQVLDEPGTFIRRAESKTDTVILGTEYSTDLKQPVFLVEQAGMTVLAFKGLVGSGGIEYVEPKWIGSGEFLPPQARAELLARVQVSLKDLTPEKNRYDQPIVKSAGKLLDRFTIGKREYSKVEDPSSEDFENLKRLFPSSAFASYAAEGNAVYVVKEGEDVVGGFVARRAGSQQEIHQLQLAAAAAADRSAQRDSVLIDIKRSISN